MLGLLLLLLLLAIFFRSLFRIPLSGRHSSLGNNFFSQQFLGNMHPGKISGYKLKFYLGFSSGKENGTAPPGVIICSKQPSNKGIHKYRLNKYNPHPLKKNGKELFLVRDSVFSVPDLTRSLNPFI